MKEGMLEKEHMNQTRTSVLNAWLPIMLRFYCLSETLLKLIESLMSGMDHFKNSTEGAQSTSAHSYSIRGDFDL